MKEIDRNDLDHDLYGMKSMSVLLEGQIEQIWNCRVSKEVGSADFYTFSLTEDQWEALSFAADHIGDMIRAAVKKYSTASEGDPDEPA